MLTRDQILSLKDLPEKVIDVPEWGGAVRIRSLTLPERFRWLKLQAAQPEGDYEAVLTKASLPMITWSVIDEEGKPLFTEADIGELGRRHPDAIQFVAGEILKLSGLGRDSVEEAEKNSETVQS